MNERKEVYIHIGADDNVSRTLRELKYITKLESYLIIIQGLCLNYSSIQISYTLSRNILLYLCVSNYSGLNVDTLKM